MTPESRMYCADLYLVQGWEFVEFARQHLLALDGYADEAAELLKVRDQIDAARLRLKERAQ